MTHPSRSLWQRLVLLPLDLLVVGSEALAQTARGARRIAQSELDRTATTDTECCGGGTPSTLIHRPLENDSESA